MSRYSRVSYTSDGSVSEYTVPFPFLSLNSLQVRIDTILKVRGTHYVVDASTNKVTFLTTPANGAVINFKRVTPRSTADRLVVFADPSDLNAATLNRSDLQLLYILQEILDDLADGIGYAGAPAEPTETITIIPPVLQDALDAANAAHQTDIDALIAQNNLTRALLEAAIADLQADIDSINPSDEITERLTLVEASAAANAAAVTIESGARADADEALGIRVDTVEATANGSAAAVVAEAVARANADSALAADITTVTAATAANAAAVTAEAAARTTADSALAAQIASVNASTGAFQAAANATMVALTNADGAMAGNISTVAAAAAAASAAVTVEQTARVTALGAIYTRWGVELNSDGKVVGRIRLDGTGATSNLDFTSDSLRVSHPSAPNVFFPTMNRSTGFTAAKVYTTGTAFSFNHGNATVLYGPSNASAVANPDKIVNVRAGAVSVLILSRILNADSVHTVYYRKNGTGGYVALGTVTSKDGAVVTLARNKFEITGISASDYLEFFVAPCDATGAIGVATASLRTELDVLAFNW